MDEIADCAQSLSKSWKWEMSDHLEALLSDVANALAYRTPLSATGSDNFGKDSDVQRRLFECRGILLDHSADPTLGVDRNAIWYACGDNMIRVPFRSLESALKLSNKQDRKPSNRCSLRGEHLSTSKPTRRIETARLRCSVFCATRSHTTPALRSYASCSIAVRVLSPETKTENLVSTAFSRGNWTRRR